MVNIDNAMKWGFNWKTGPFETWDALGVEESVAKMKAAGLAVPAWVEEMLAAGCKTFYKKEAGKMMYYDVASKSYKDVPVNPNIILLPSLKEQNKVRGQQQRSLCHRHGRTALPASSSTAR